MKSKFYNYKSIKDNKTLKNENDEAISDISSINKKDKTRKDIVKTQSKLDSQNKHSKSFI